MTQQPRIRIHIFLLCSVFVLLSVYVFSRAYQTSITHDEALSYQIIKGDEALKGTANHHPLNTWLMSASFRLFGNSELALRLPNLLGFVLYLFSCFFLLRYAPFWITWCVSLPLLLFIEYLLEFFGIARGYGLSVGLMLPGILLGLECWKGAATPLEFLKKFCGAMIFLTLALAANLVLLNLYLVVFAVLTLRYCFVFRRERLQTLSVLILVFLVPPVLALLRLLFLKEKGELYFGAEDFDSTLISMVICSVDYNGFPAWFPGIIRTLMKVIFCLSLFAVIFKRKYFSPLGFISVVIGLVVLAHVLQGWLFSALFPMHRTGVYFFPLFALLCHFLCSSVNKTLGGWNTVLATILITVLFTVPWTLHFLKRMNLGAVYEWTYDAHSKEIIPIAKTFIDLELQDQNRVLGYQWLFGPSLTYYNERCKADLDLQKVENEDTQNSAVVYQFQQDSIPRAYSAVRRFDDISTALYVSKNALTPR
jgi:hypothetical protein